MWPQAAVPRFDKASDAPPAPKPAKVERPSEPPASTRPSNDDRNPVASPDDEDATPATDVRRERFARFVRVCLAVSVALCLFAVLRGVISRTRTAAPPAPSANDVRATSAPRDQDPEPALAPAPVLDFDAAIAGTPEGAKREALIALEARRLPEAIAAGERAVALDATDGEAWLILGAAYQENYQLGEARRCYRACVVKGKVDPRGECAAMLR